MSHIFQLIRRVKKKHAHKRLQSHAGPSWHTKFFSNSAQCVLLQCSGVSPCFTNHWVVCESLVSLRLKRKQLNLWFYPSGNLLLSFLLLLWIILYQCIKCLCAIISVFHWPSDKVHQHLDLVKIDCKDLHNYPDTVSEWLKMHLADICFLFAT